MVVFVVFISIPLPLITVIGLVCLEYGHADRQRDMRQTDKKTDTDKPTDNRLIQVI